MTKLFLFTWLIIVVIYLFPVPANAGVHIEYRGEQQYICFGTQEPYKCYKVNLG